MRYLSALAVLCYSLFLFPRFTPYINEDSAQYIILAQALRYEGAYKMLNFPHEPPCEYYPPLWPLLLSFFVKGGSNIFPLTTLSYILLLCTLLCLLLVIKGERWSILALLLFSFNPYFLYLRTQLLSEPLFLILLYLAIFFALGYLKRGKLSYLAFASVCLGLAYMTRHIGLVIFFAFVLYLCLAKRDIRGFILLGVIFLLFYLPWEIRNLKYSSPFSGNYLKACLQFDPYRPFLGMGDLRHLSLRYLLALNYILYDFTWGLLPPRGFQFLRIFMIFLLILGLSFRIKSDIKLYDFIAGFYILCLPFWPYYLEFKRLLLPVLPFLCLWYIEGVDVIIRNGRFKHLLMWVMVVASLVFSNKGLEELKLQGEKEAKDLIGICLWIRENLHDEGVIFSQSPARVYLFSRHKAVYFYPSNIEIFNSVLRYFRVKYLLYNGASEKDRVALYPLIQGFGFKLLKRRGKCCLYLLR